MKQLAFALALLASSFGSYAVPPPTDYSGVYFNSNQSGYGYNLVQTDKAIFVTAYVYRDFDSNLTGVPFWFIAVLFWNGVDAFEGDGYLTSGGTDFFKPWVKGSVNEEFFRKVKFTPSAGDSYTGTLVTGTVTHVLERLPITDIDLRGSYAGAVYDVRTCANGTFPAVRAADISVTIIPPDGQTKIQFKYADTPKDCMLVGAIEQHGQIHVMPTATYSCGSATASASSPEIRRTPQGLEGRFVAATGVGCNSVVRFNATAAPPGLRLLP